MKRELQLSKQSIDEFGCRTASLKGIIEDRDAHIRFLQSKLASFAGGKDAVVAGMIAFPDQISKPRFSVQDSFEGNSWLDEISCHGDRNTVDPAVEAVGREFKSIFNKTNDLLSQENFRKYQSDVKREATGKAQNYKSQPNASPTRNRNLASSRRDRPISRDKAKRRERLNNMVWNSSSDSDNGFNSDDSDVFVAKKVDSATGTNNMLPSYGQLHQQLKETQSLNFSLQKMISIADDLEKEYLAKIEELEQEKEVLQGLVRKWAPVVFQMEKMSKYTASHQDEMIDRYINEHFRKMQDEQKHPNNQSKSQQQSSHPSQSVDPWKSSHSVELPFTERKKEVEWNENRPPNHIFEPLQECPSSVDSSRIAFHRNHTDTINHEIEREGMYSCPSFVRLVDNDRNRTKEDPSRHSSRYPMTTSLPSSISSSTTSSSSSSSSTTSAIHSINSLTSSPSLHSDCGPSLSQDVDDREDRSTTSKQPDKIVLVTTTSASASASASTSASASALASASASTSSHPPKKDNWDELLLSSEKTNTLCLNPPEPPSWRSEDIIPTKAVVEKQQKTSMTTKSAHSQTKSVSCPAKVKAREIMAELYKDRRGQNDSETYRSTLLYPKSQNGREESQNRSQNNSISQKKGSSRQTTLPKKKSHSIRGEIARILQEIKD